MPAMIAAPRQARTPDDRELVVRCELLHAFMRESRYRQVAIAGMKASIVFLCLGYVPTAWLMAWFAVGIAVIVLRFTVERRFRFPGSFDTVEGQDRFVSAMKPIYTLHAAIWGISTLFYFNRLPTSDQYACGVIIACVAALPLRSAALVPQLLRIFMNTLFLVTIVCLVVASMTPLIYDPDIAQLSGKDWVSGYLFIAAPVFEWWLLSSVGRRVHANQRRQYEALYDLETKEEQARGLAQSRMRFLAAAAHDLRQPATALAIYADQLVEYPEDHLALAPRIARASSAINHLFDSLFDLANLDNGKVELDIRTVPVDDLLRDLQDQFESIAGAKSIALQVRSSGERVSTDSVRLRRMLGNVISNAIKYSDPGTRIVITAKSTDAGVSIDVLDEGFGISEADQMKVFDEFYRVSRPDRETVDGVGLGLSIVLRLARLLRCEVRLSSAVGQGTRVAFYLPVVEERSRGPQTSFGVG